MLVKQKWFRNLTAVLKCTVPSCNNTIPIHVQSLQTHKHAHIQITNHWLCAKRNSSSAQLTVVPYNGMKKKQHQRTLTASLIQTICIQTRVACTKRVNKNFFRCEIFIMFNKKILHQVFSGLNNKRNWQCSKRTLNLVGSFILAFNLRLNRNF